MSARRHGAQTAEQGDIVEGAGVPRVCSRASIGRSRKPVGAMERRPCDRCMLALSTYTQQAYSDGDARTETSELDRLLSETINLPARRGSTQRWID